MSKMTEAWNSFIDTMRINDDGQFEPKAEDSDDVAEEDAVAEEQVSEEEPEAEAEEPEAEAEVVAETKPEPKAQPSAPRSTTRKVTPQSSWDGFSRSVQASHFENAEQMIQRAQQYAAQGVEIVPDPSGVVR